MRLFFLLLLAVFQVTVTGYLLDNPDFYQLDAYTWESDDFRAMQLGPWMASRETLNCDELTACMIEWEYDLTEYQPDHASLLESAEGGWEKTAERIAGRRPAEYRKLRNAYGAVFQDLAYFPIPDSTNPSVPDVTYEDGWMDVRTYGGERGHEGCDLMGSAMPRGYYPVVSMSSGVVEQAGWLEQGGWRIGIRTPSGLYLYYAHLYSYSRPWQEGDHVEAGQLLGFMGDSGYSEIEGTVGNFDVHLHVGMYLRTDHYDELSINPYWILRYLEKRKLVYQY